MFPPPPRCLKSETGCVVRELCQYDASERRGAEKTEEGMIQLFGFDIGSSVSEIAQGVADIILAAGAVAGGVFGFKKWSDGKALARSKTLDSLLEKFNKNELRKLVCKIDSSGGASDLIKSAMSEAGENDKLKVEDALMFVALLCQLKSNDVISETEFLLFKDSVLKILDDDDVKVYISQAVIDSGLEPEDTHYAYLLKFASENGINMNVATGPIDSRKDTPMKQNTNMVETAVPSGAIQESEFDVPTAIIKINRKYREGMNDDEIREAVRGWWRLRLDIAQKVKIVLAVANGCVKGVYRVQKWIPATSPDDRGRIGFIGETADEATCKKFKGRSTKTLFCQGAANPVRYFNVK